MTKDHPFDLHPSDKYPLGVSYVTWPLRHLTGGDAISSVAGLQATYLGAKGKNLPAKIEVFRRERERLDYLKGEISHSDIKAPDAEFLKVMEESGQPCRKPSEF